MKGIASKLVKVMAECAYIQRQGINDFHRYKYAMAADVLEKVNAAMVKYNLAATAVPELVDFREITNLKGNTERLATVKTTLTITDADSGESISIVGIGSGQDPGDKAVMKAQTASIKYAYMLSLAMATGDDPEADSGGGRAVSTRRTERAPGIRWNDLQRMWYIINARRCQGFDVKISQAAVHEVSERC